MTAPLKPQSRLRLDVFSLVLIMIGLLFGTISYVLVTYSDTNVLVIVPSVVAVTIGAMNLVKREAPRDGRHMSSR